MHQFRIAKREGGEGLWLDEVEGLLGLVSIGAVELHAWTATVDAIEHADMLVFDLDPGGRMAKDDVVRVTHEQPALWPPVRDKTSASSCLVWARHFLGIGRG